MSDIVVHPGPIEERVNGSIGSFNSLMSSNGGIMMVVEDLGSKGTFGDAEVVEVIVKDSIRAQAVVSQQRGRHRFVNRKSS